MIDEVQHIFVDEFGNPSLETQKSAVTDYFIIVATLISDPDLANVEVLVEKVSKKYFQGSEIKSSNVKTDNRRIKILQDISELKAKYYVLAIDKNQIDKKSGLIYKKSFLKFLHGVLYRQLFEVYPNVRIIADEHGYPEFMEGFKKYVNKNHIPNLFERSSFDFANSKENSLIQISDFIAGTLARVFEPDKRSDESNNFLKIIGENIICIDEWPIKSNPFTGKMDISTSEGYDEDIRRLAINQASLFIERNESTKDDQVKDQIEVLKYLL
ncbi:MAG: DUF3800 domain-containing protein, partial [Cytophagia bacterium]|nr:DUF3800 domain-containing protein [Cytophagia bacterium]